MSRSRVAAISPVEIKRGAIAADAHFPVDATAALMTSLGLLAEMEGEQLRVLEIKPKARVRVPRRKKPPFAHERYETQCL